MPAFTLATNLQLNNQSVNGNGSYTLWTSSVENNNNSLQSLRLIVDYSNPTPNTNIQVTAIIESQQGSNWYPIAYQFSPFNNVDNGKQRIILLQPNISTFDSGIDDDIYVADSVIARISRQQGKVGANFRVRIILNETQYGTQYAFQNVTVNCYGEIFD